MFMLQKKNKILSIGVFALLSFTSPRQGELEGKNRDLALWVNSNPFTSASVGPISRWNDQSESELYHSKGIQASQSAFSNRDWDFNTIIPFDGNNDSFSSNFTPPLINQSISIASVSNRRSDNQLNYLIERQDEISLLTDNLSYKYEIDTSKEFLFSFSDPTTLSPAEVNLSDFTSFGSDHASLSVALGPPTDIQIDGANTTSINENRPIKSLVGVLTTSDVDVNDSHTYTLVAGVGDDDNSSFTIQGGLLLSYAVFDFETKNSYTVRIQSKDTNGNTYQEALTISINDIAIENDIPNYRVWRFETPANYSNSASTVLTIDKGIGQLTSFFTENNITGDLGYSDGPKIEDLNNDGNNDIYVPNTSQQNRLWLGDGTGNFTNGDIPGDTGASYGSAIGDVNNDGNLDIYTVNYNQQNRLWLGDGMGGFTNRDITGDTGLSIGASMGDVNGDGNLDIYVASSNNAPNLLWLGDGTGSFTNANIPGDGGNSFGSAIGDVNNDGFQDIYVGNGGAQNRLWLGSSSGVFTNADITGDIGENSQRVEMDDFNADGNLDLYTTNGNINSQNFLWIGDGTGGFTAGHIAGDLSSALGVDSGDVNRDGFIDIYVTNTGQNFLWLGSPTGFTSGSIPGDTGPSFDTALGDLNNDGYLDLYVANYENEQNTLWLNGFSTNSPYITASTAVNFPSTLLSFSETLGSQNGGTVSYQVSTDNGTTWKYWNGTAWTTTTQTDGSQTSSAIVINANINTLDTDGGEFLWRAYFNSNGSQRVDLDQITFAFNETDVLQIMIP